MFDVSPTKDSWSTRLSAGVDALAGENRAGWHGMELSARLGEVMELRERLEAETLRLLGEWDRARAWEADGALSAASWMTHRLPVARNPARAEIRAARLIDRNQRAAKALAAGDITSEHVKAMARVVSNHRVGRFADHEDTLVDAAMRLRVGDFTTLMRRWACLADDQLAADTFRHQFERRRCNVASTGDGTVLFNGALDPDGGATLLTALDALSKPDPTDGPDRPRTLTQRRADALVRMARIALDHANPTRAPVNLSVVIDLDSLTGADEAADLRETAWCDLGRLGPIARRTALRLACDPVVSRIIMAGRSEVLDVGRRTRLVTSAQRRALAVRDRGCAFPGCDRPESWCDAHHRRHWAHRGPTDLDNLVLLCRRHHVLCHEGGWRLEADANGGLRARAPDGRRPP